MHDLVQVPMLCGTNWQCSENIVVEVMLYFKGARLSVDLTMEAV